MCNFCNGSVYYETLCKAADNIYGPIMGDHYAYWAAFDRLRRELGLCELEYQFTDWTERIEKKMVLLSGPYGKTLFKAMKIRRKRIKVNARSATR